MDNVTMRSKERRNKALKQHNLVYPSLLDSANPQPGKSILKIQSVQSPLAKVNNEEKRVSMNPNATVWEVETDYASPSRANVDSNIVGSTQKSANDPVVTRENGPTVSTKQQQGNDKGTFFHGVSNANYEQVSSDVGDAGPKQGASNANVSMADSFTVGASDASGTTSLGNEAKQIAGPKVTTSFASVIKTNTNKVVQIAELRNEEHVEGAAVALPLSAIEEVSSRFANTLYGYFVGKRLAFRLVENYVHNAWAKFGIKRIQLHGDFFLFQFENKEGMDRVLESGPWLIRMVPLILNVWSPDCDLHKAEIKKVPVWVKLHHVPIVAYSEVGLSLITTQIGKPIRLDTYTSNMCLNSWGRSAYARALIEISADEVLKEDLVIAIPVGKDKGHSLVTIKIEYEWRPPRCSTCLIFDHVNDKCPKLPKVVSSVVVNDVIEDAAKHSNGTADDGFEVAKKKRSRKKKHQKQVDGVVLSKPSLNLHYRRVDKENSTKQSVASTSKVGKSTSTGVYDKNVRLENSFSALNDDEESDLNDTITWQHTQQVLNVLNESDSDVDEEITLDDRGGNLKTT